MIRRQSFLYSFYLYIIEKIDLKIIVNRIV